MVLRASYHLLKTGYPQKMAKMALSYEGLAQIKHLSPTVN